MVACVTCKLKQGGSPRSPLTAEETPLQADSALGSLPDVEELDACQCAQQVINILNPPISELSCLLQYQDVATLLHPPCSTRIQNPPRTIRMSQLS